MTTLNEKILSAYEGMLTEGKIDTVSEFMKQLEAAIRKYFPKSFVRIQSSKNLGSSIFLSFAIGKDKSQWLNGIFENDPVASKFMIGFDSFADDKFIKDKILAEIISGGSLTIKPEPGSHLAFSRVKLGWRKKTATPDKIIKHFENYFKKMKKIVNDHKEDIPDDQYNLIKKNI